MISRFEKGWTYLVLTVGTKGKQGWIVQQTGQKSWVASQFTNCVTEADGSYAVLLGNSIKVFEDLKERSNVADIEILRVNQKTSMRHTMFNILQYGSFYEQGEEL